MPKYEVIGLFITELPAETEDEARRIIWENLDYNIGIDPKQTVLITREVQESDEKSSAAYQD